MRFVIVSVFHAGDPYRGGNPLAVFPETGDLGPEQMQAIAQTLNLSETTFVTGGDDRSYDVRIFTPGEELPFAGHPTIGTAWTLRHLGRLKGDAIVQRSAAGETPLTSDGEMLYFERSGKAGADRADTDERAHLKIARALGLEERDVGLEAYELGRHGMLRPASSDAGLEHFVVPVRNAAALARAQVDGRLLRELSPIGCYCVTALGAGRVRTRGFFPGLGVDEDPATGSAAACLGVYLADRVGDIELHVEQGIEMGRPCQMEVKATTGTVRVGGACDLLLSGELERIP